MLGRQRQSSGFRTTAPVCEATSEQGRHPKLHNRAKPALTDARRLPRAAGVDGHFSDLCSRVELSASGMGISRRIFVKRP